MAVDTRAKRFSMMGLASGGDGCQINVLMGDPDGSNLDGADERAAMFDTYGGITFASPAGGTILPQIMQHEAA